MSQPSAVVVWRYVVGMTVDRLKWNRSSPGVGSHATLCAAVRRVERVYSRDDAHPLGTRGRVAHAVKPEDEQTLQVDAHHEHRLHQQPVGPHVQHNYQPSLIDTSYKIEVYRQSLAICAINQWSSVGARRYYQLSWPTTARLSRSERPPFSS